MKSLVHDSLKSISAGLSLLCCLLAQQAGAALTTWDPQGLNTQSPFSTLDLSGTWEANNWSTSQTGQATPQAWAEGSAAVFAVNTGTGTPAYTITMNGNHTVAGIFNGPLTPNPCQVTITGTGTMTMASGIQGISVNSNTSNPGYVQINNVIRDAGAGSPCIIIPQGTGQIYLNGANTWTGGMELGYSGGLFSGIVNFNNSASFGTGGICISNTGASICALVAEGSGGVTIPNNVTNKVGGKLNIVGGTLGTTFSGKWFLTNTATIGSGVADNKVIISGVISGAGGFNKFNPGLMEFTGANTFTGGTTVSNGVLQLGDGATLNSTVGGTIGVWSTGSLVWANPNAMTYSKVISGTGPVTYQGPGILTLGAANTYSGATTISAGTVKLGVANALPGAAKGDVSLAAGATLDMGGFSDTLNGFGGEGTVDNSAGATTYTLTVGNGNDGGTFSGIIKNTSGTVALTKTGSGLLNLSGANTYAGNTIVNGGTLQLGVDNALPAASSVSLASGTTLDLNNVNDTIAALGGGGTVNNLNGIITVNGNAATVLTQNFNGFSCIAGVLSGGGTLNKGGTHAMAFRSSTSSFGGPINFNGGTLSVGAAPDLLPASYALNVPGAALFQLDANNQTVSTLTGTGSVNLGGGVLSVNQNGTATFNGVIQNSELPGSSTALGHGLRGYYYTNIDFTGLGTVRDDSTVSLLDMSYLPGYPSNTKTQQVSVRWLGKLLTTASGQYIISTKCDDGARLWVGGTLAVDDYTTHGATQRNWTNSLSGNTEYDIVMEYFNNGSGGSAQLLWTPPNDNTAVLIPTANLLLPGAGTLVKGGGGSQTLAVASTYTGGTTVSAGTLEASTGGALGSGNVTVADGATLTLDSSATVNAAADVIVGASASAVNLTYSGTDNIHALSLDGGGTYQAAGTYGSPTSTAGHKFSVFTGNGILNVTAGPSTTVLVPSTSSAVYGATVILTATVSGGATPTGTVTFYDGANLLGTSSLVSGMATFNVNNLLVDYSPHSLTAVYSGDSTHVSSTSIPASVSTSQATLVPTVVIANKIYDATDVATIASLAGMLPSDSNYVHIATGYTATFSDKNVANGKTVTITGMSLEGSLADNYALSTTSTNTTANITPKALTVTGITASAKPYDATTGATLNVAGATLQGPEDPGTGTTADGKPYNGDTLSLATGGAAGTFSDPNAANNKTVTINGLTLDGADAGNYTITPPTTTANITKIASACLLTSSSNPSCPGSSVTFTATLSGAAGTPSGGATFYTNNVFLGTNVLAGGVASTNTAALPVGSTTVQVRYTGDVNFVGSTNSLPQVVDSSACTGVASTTISNIVNNLNNTVTINYGGGNGVHFILMKSLVVPNPTRDSWTPVKTNSATPGSFTTTLSGNAFYTIQSSNN